MKASWNNQIIAESDETIVVEGNHYFPRSAVAMEFLQTSPTQTSCHWKGKAHYYTLKIEGVENRDAAWFFPEPKLKASELQGRIAFFKGVRITEA